MTNIKTLVQNIQKEEERSLQFLHLTANENQVSKTVRLFLNSPLSDRYYMGGGDENSVVDMNPFTALGIQSVEDLVNKAEETGKNMLSAEAINLNVLSGVHAMMSSILAVTEPSDTVLTVHHDAGGHFATKGILDRIGRKHGFVSYDLENLRFNVEETAKTVKELGATAIYLDVSYYLNPHNLKELREAVGENITIIYDASHTMGLIMGQEFQAPLKEGANVVCANTHKTLPAVHKGMIAFRDADLGLKANSIINGCLYSTNHLTHMIGLSITILEMEAFGKEYAKQIISNSRAIGNAFSELGYAVRKANNGEYSNNHQAHVFIDDKGVRGELYKNLVKNNISTNFDSPLGDRLFIRVGTQELTRRGLKENDVKEVANLVHRALIGEDVKSDVIEFNNSFRDIHYSFDEEMGL
ncbi:MAG: hypothetical protein ACOZAO_03720 [Patescibacteria group bacterium]